MIPCLAKMPADCELRRRQTHAPRCAAEPGDSAPHDARTVTVESATMSATPQLTFPTLWLIVPIGSCGTYHTGFGLMTKLAARRRIAMSGMGR